MGNMQIRVVFESENIFVESVEQAQHLADEKGLDLVQVAPNVYKIMDYQKHLFKQSKQTKKKSSPSLKEMQFNLVIAQGDFQRKAKDICKWLTRGNHVRIVVKLRGREQMRPEMVIELMNRILGAVQAQGVAYNASEMVAPGKDSAGRDVTITLRPAK